MSSLTGGSIRKAVIRTKAGEASDLLAVQDIGALGELGWDWAFWTVIDEARVERAIALVGHREGAAATKGWELRHLRGKLRGEKGSTEDAEACARHDGFVYAFGSHYGGKSGPLARERAFVGRFAESELGRIARGKKLRIELVRDKFLLHRVLNDALLEFGPEILELGEEIEERFVGAARKAGRKGAKAWARRLHRGDVPLNIEGAAFRPGGGLLLGFRFPVTSEGEPIVAELDGVHELFAGRPHRLRVRGFWVLSGVGSPAAPEGIRALELHGSKLEAVTGSLDSVGKGSLLVGDYRGAARAHCDHRTAELPNAPARSEPGTRSLASSLTRSFPELSDVEGVSFQADGSFAYVTDQEDEVALRLVV